MTKKDIVRVVVFVAVFCLMVVALCDLFELGNNSNYDKRFTTLRSFADDTIDAVYIGTSGADRYWIAAKAYEEYGMTVYPLSSDAMPTWLFTNVIDEVYTYQDPELILIDLRAYGQSNEKKTVMDARARRVLDAMSPFSINYVKTAFKTMASIHSVFEDQSKWDLSYLLSFIKYHSKWADEDFSFEKGFGNKEHNYAGFFVNKTLSMQAEPQKAVVYDPHVIEPLDPLTESSLYELLEYIEKKDLNVLFVDTPQFKNETEMGRANAVYKILDEHGVEYIHFFTEGMDGAFTIEFDWKKDFYDEGHVNYYGAEKFTDAFAAYLDEHYDFPDRRNDPGAAAYWDGKYQNIVEKMADYEKRYNRR